MYFSYGPVTQWMEPVTLMKYYSQELINYQSLIRWAKAAISLPLIHLLRQQSIRSGDSYAISQWDLLVVDVALRKSKEFQGQPTGASKGVTTQKKVLSGIQNLQNTLLVKSEWRKLQILSHIWIPSEKLGYLDL